MVSRFDVYLINLDTQLSGDPKNTRPAVVVSPDEVNHNLDAVIIAPLASSNTPYPTRIEVDFLNAKRFVILIRSERSIRIGSSKRSDHWNGPRTALCSTACRNFLRNSPPSPAPCALVGTRLSQRSRGLPSPLGRRPLSNGRGLSGRLR